jgi:hypothetical protein
MAPVKAVVDALTDERFAAARRAGEREPREAYAMDALAEACRRLLDGDDAPPCAGALGESPDGGDPPGSSEAPAGGVPPPDRAGQGAAPSPRRPRRVRYLGIIRVDLTALRRGSVGGDEVCEIAGLGPVPVAVARELLGDAALHLVLTSGLDVANVTSLSRSPSVAMRIALQWLGTACTVEGCNRPAVEIDHRADWARTRRTRLADLDAYCRHHHAKKTHAGWGLVAGAGKRRMVPPDDPEHPDHTGGCPDRAPPVRAAP